MVLIPLQCEALSHRGVGQLLETIEDVRQFANDKLGVLGVVPTMYDGRTTHARKVLGEVGERYGLRVFDPPVPKSVRFAEAPELGRSVLQHAPSSPGAAAYRSLAVQVFDSMEPDLTWPADPKGRLRIRWASGPCTGPPRLRPVRTSPATRRPRPPCSRWANGRCTRAPAPRRTGGEHRRTTH